MCLQVSRPATKNPHSIAHLSLNHSFCLVQHSTCHGCSYLGLICGYLQTCRPLIIAAWNKSQNGPFKWLEIQKMILCVSSVLPLGGGGAPFCYDKIVTFTCIAKCFLWESQLLEKGLRNTLFKWNYALNLTPRLSFCWEKYRNSRAVILLPALSHQDTRVFLSRDQSARAELLRAEKSSWSLWTHAGLLSIENRFPSLSSSKEFTLSWTPSFLLLGPTLNKRPGKKKKKKKKKASNPECCIWAGKYFSSV